MWLEAVPQPARWHHSESEGGETPPEALARPRRPRAMKPNKRGGSSGLKRCEVVKGRGARVHDVDRVWEGMRLEHRTNKGGDLVRIIVNDNDGPRGQRGGRLHNAISSRRVVRARSMSETSRERDVQPGVMMFA
jgi:hypothetical protein